MNKKIKETEGDAKCLYQNELDKGCLQYDMAYRYFKDLPRRTAAEEVLGREAFNIAKKSEIRWISKRSSFKDL